MQLKIPWYIRIIFTLISILAFYFAFASNNIFTLAGLGITGIVAALDLVIKGIELSVNGLGLFLEVGIKKNTIIRHIADWLVLVYGELMITG